MEEGAVLFFLLLKIKNNIRIQLSSFDNICRLPKVVKFIYKFHTTENIIIEDFKYSYTKKLNHLRSTLKI
jgi:hypothetical protein